MPSVMIVCRYFFPFGSIHAVSQKITAYSELALVECVITCDCKSALETMADHPIHYLITADRRIPRARFIYPKIQGLHILIRKLEIKDLCVLFHARWGN